jgi:signal peptidase I
MNAATRAINISAFAALMLVAAWLFWPTALGGGTTYVTTHGTSMQPRFHTGDLGILRSAGSYAVGDIVAYRSESLKTTVMHRIVALDGDRFVIQGDNNDWLDQDHPSKDEVLGRLFVRIPQGGKALTAVSSPGVIGLVGVATLTVLGSARRPRGRHGIRSSRRRPARRSPTFSMPARVRARQVALGSGAVALLAAVGGGVLLALPSTQTDTRTLQVIQQGTFSYTGAAEPGTTYPNGVISTGDPVYTKLTDGLTVSFQDTVSGPGPGLESVTGTAWLDLSVSTPDGWTAALGRGATASVANGTVTASAEVDPARAAAFLTKHYAEIGANPGGASLIVTPTVQMTGTLAGQAFATDPMPALTFALDATALRVGGDPAAALAPTARTAVVVDEVVPRSFPVLGFSIPIVLARIAAGVVLGMALIGLAAGAWIGRSRRGDVADDFLVRHAARILPVAAFTPGQTVVDVSDAESLHKVAERLDGLVLHHAGPDGQVLAVQDSDITYRYVFPDGLSQRPKPPLRALSPVTPVTPHTTPMARIA